MYRAGLDPHVMSPSHMPPSTFSDRLPPNLSPPPHLRPAELPHPPKPSFKPVFGARLDVAATPRETPPHKTLHHQPQTLPPLSLPSTNLPSLKELFSPDILVTPQDRPQYSRPPTAPVQSRRLSSASSSTSYSNPHSATVDLAHLGRSDPAPSYGNLEQSFGPVPRRESYAGPPPLHRSSQSSSISPHDEFQYSPFDMIHSEPHMVRTADRITAAPQPQVEQLYQACPTFCPSDSGFQANYQGIRNFPGRGTYHVYEGGFCIPTHVDGQQVNPHWGLTKANRPRKRLSIACHLCRKKKIRCEPTIDGCNQCKKSHSICRPSDPHNARPYDLTSPPHQGHGLQSTPSP